MDNNQNTNSTGGSQDNQAASLQPGAAIPAGATIGEAPAAPQGGGLQPGSPIPQGATIGNAPPIDNSFSKLGHDISSAATGFGKEFMHTVGGAYDLAKVKFPV